MQNTPNFMPISSMGRAHASQAPQATIATNMPHKNNMLYSCFRAYKLKEASPIERRAASDILNAHLLMVEIMMSSIVQKHVHNVYYTLTERGLMRHNVKRQANLLKSLSLDLIGRCNSHNVAQVEVFCRDIYPSLVQEFIKNGGSLTIKLQLQFDHLHDEKMKRIYFATKNAVDKTGVAQSDLLSQIFMITMLTHTGIEFYNLMAQKTDKLMEGFGKITRVKSQHNEKILCAAKELLRSCGCPSELPEREASHARTLTAQFQKQLTNEDLLQLIEQGITSLRMDFIEFVIATLRMKIADGALHIRDIRTLLARLGSMKNVRKLLSEISEISLPQFDGWDVIDLVQSITDISSDSAISSFRRLCIEDHILHADIEDLQTIRLRELRQEARKNQGQLPVGTLKQLFAEMGTKKAVLNFLASGGFELHTTIKKLRDIKIKELTGVRA